MEIITFTIIGILSRLLPHLPNMTAVGATSLFMGATYGVKKSLIVLLATMLIADSIMGLHSVMWATYGSLFLAILIGKHIVSKRSAGWIIGGTLLSSVIFFVITNFAVWLAPNFMYEKTLSGLIACYTMALPFFRNTVIGDLVYTSIFFGGFAFVTSIKQKYLVRQINQ
ncbi:MAG: DUF6580 family putative transport protein [Candidatus Gottesmanbacteria bacterium]